MDNFLFVPRAAVSGLYDLLFAALTGVMLAIPWLVKAATLPLRRRLRHTFAVVSGLLLLALVLQIGVTTATMVGTGDLQQVLPAVRDVLLTTHAGRVTGMALVPAGGLLLLAFFADRRYVMGTSWLLLTALLVLRAATGHAAGNGDFTLDEAMQLVHLGATAVWAGSILIAGLQLAPRLLQDAGCDGLTVLGRQVSRYATASIVLVIATGVTKSWRGLGGALSPLAHTQWGLLLTAKGALVVLALLVGLFNRWLLQRGAVLVPKDAASLIRGLRFEAVLMVAILTLSALLANSPPAIGTSARRGAGAHLLRSCKVLSCKNAAL